MDRSAELTSVADARLRLDVAFKPFELGCAGQPLALCIALPQLADESDDDYEALVCYVTKGDVPADIEVPERQAWASRLLTFRRIYMQQLELIVAESQLRYHASHLRSTSTSDEHMQGFSSQLSAASQISRRALTHTDDEFSESDGAAPSAPKESGGGLRLVDRG